MKITALGMVGSVVVGGMLGAFANSIYCGVEGNEWLAMYWLACSWMLSRVVKSVDWWC